MPSNYILRFSGNNVIDPAHNDSEIQSFVALGGVSVSSPVYQLRSESSDRSTFRVGVTGAGSLVIQRNPRNFNPVNTAECVGNGGNTTPSSANGAYGGGGGGAYAVAQNIPAAFPLWLSPGSPGAGSNQPNTISRIGPSTSLDPQYCTAFSGTNGGFGNAGVGGSTSFPAGFPGGSGTVVAGVGGFGGGAAGPSGPGGDATTTSGGTANGGVVAPGASGTEWGFQGCGGGGATPPGTNGAQAGGGGGGNLMVSFAMQYPTPSAAGGFCVLTYEPLPLPRIQRAVVMA